MSLMTCRSAALGVVKPPGHPAAWHLARTTILRQTELRDATAKKVAKTGATPDWHVEICIEQLSRARCLLRDGRSPFAVDSETPPTCSCRRFLLVSPNTILSSLRVGGWR
ncbi:hypothetical protein CGRA01v4_04727 [Colletotrichum graminicola]|nr:hypothetical protein CGRA01v4_04727 [Colletotrichum graminicola]